MALAKMMERIGLRKRRMSPEERSLEKGLKDTFPASDPPAATQPGSGITGFVEPRDPAQERRRRSVTLDEKAAPKSSPTKSASKSSASKASSKAAKGGKAARRG